MKQVKTAYTEPVEYMPDEIQKKYKIGKYAPEPEATNQEKKDTRTRQQENDELRRIIRGK